MKTESVFVILILLLLIGCGGSRKNENEVKQIARRATSEDINSLIFSYKGYSHYSAKIFMQKDSSVAGLFFDFKVNDSVLYQKQILPNEYYDIDVLNGLESKILGNKEYLFFILREQMQGNGSAGLVDLGIYLFDLTAKSMLKLTYGGRSVLDTTLVVGRIENPNEVPSDPVLATFIFQKMMSNKDFACISLDPFEKYIDNIGNYFTDDRIIYPEGLFELAHCQTVIYGSWYELEMNPKDSTDFYFPSPCKDYYKINSDRIERLGKAYSDEIAIASCSMVYKINDVGLPFHYKFRGGNSEDISFGHMDNGIWKLTTETWGVKYVTMESNKDAFRVIDDGPCP